MEGRGSQFYRMVRPSYIFCTTVSIIKYLTTISLISRGPISTINCQSMKILRLLKPYEECEDHLKFNCCPANDLLVYCDYVPSCVCMCVCLCACVHV